MRKSSFEDTFDRFFYWINWYTDLLVKVTEDKRVISFANEKKEIYEAFVLKICATWEIFVEELLVNCLNRDTSQYADYKAVKIPKNLSSNVCMCLITGLGFFDFKSAGDIKGIAKKILVNKFNPFPAIPKKDAARIDEFLIIRNYLAHYSAKSKQSLMCIYKKNYDFKNFREPGDFLFANDKQTKQIRFANYIDSFLNAADEMGVFMGV